MSVIEPYGVSKFVIAKTNRMPQDFQIALRKSLYKIGKKLHKDAFKSFTDKPKHGRVYLIRKNGKLKKHKSSAPGEAPAKITGKSRDTLGFNVQGYMRLEFGYRTSDLEYPKWLELGTKIMKPRPALKLAIDKNEKEIINYFTQEINKAIAGK